MRKHMQNQFKKWLYKKKRKRSHYRLTNYKRSKNRSKFPKAILFSVRRPPYQHVSPNYEGMREGEMKPRFLGGRSRWRRVPRIRRVRTFKHRRPIHGWSLALAVWIGILISFSVVIPGFLVKSENSDSVSFILESIRDSEHRVDQSHAPKNLHIEEGSLEIPVYLSKEKETVTMPLEMYVSGVVAAEMPPEFELEALKAQAIAARTYIIRRMKEQNFSQVPAEEAWVTDTVTHQAFLTVDGIKQQWGLRKTARYLEKVYDAVNETAGMIITYEGEPIDATFFSTSNGYTENSEEYWMQEVPYLRSVPSPWDQDLSPKYEQVTRIPIADVYRKLGLQEVAASTDVGLGLQVLDRTEGKRIKEVQIGGKSFSGREIREKLDLASSHFQWQVIGSEIEITSFGYGHGVGMSQYGAQGMALQGRTAEQILKYYYQGIVLQDWRQTLSN